MAWMGAEEGVSTLDIQFSLKIIEEKIQAEALP